MPKLRCISFQFDTGKVLYYPLSVFYPALTPASSTYVCVIFKGDEIDPVNQFEVLHSPTLANAEIMIDTYVKK